MTITASLIAGSMIGLVSSSIAAGDGPQPVAADVCGSPTRTLTGGGNSAFALSSGDVLLLSSGTYTGGSNAMPSGSTLCVGVDAAFRPAYLNNPHGTIVVLGAATLGSLAASDGFVLDVRGSLAAPGGANLNGAATLAVGPGATASLGTVTTSTGSVVLNEGTATMSQLSLNGGALLDNRGDLTIGSALTSNGAVLNTGSLAVGGSLTLNGGASFANSCTVTVSGDLSSNTGASLNDGHVRLSGTLRVNGEWSQTLAGMVAAGGLNNDGTVSGYGRYRFAGDTRTQGAVLGGSGADPIVVEDLTPPPIPRIFDLQSGTIANVAAGMVTLPPDDARPAGCATRDGSAADIRVAITGPATGTPGAVLAYPVTVANAGPASAAGVTVVVTVPAGLDVTLPDGATRSGDRVTWTLGTVAVADTRTLTLTGTASAPGDLVVRVAAGSTTADHAPANNDGSAPEHAVTTTVGAAVPGNNPPVVADVTVRTAARQAAPGVVPGADPDPGQTLAFTLRAPATSGTVTLALSGAYTYTPTGDFTGQDTFDVRACDNGSPVMCDDATVTVLVVPALLDIAAGTAYETPVEIAVKTNDVGRTRAGIAVTQPDHGTVTVVGDAARYAPETGYVGTDVFRYSVCSEDGIACAEARVVVVVAAATNHAPAADDVALTAAFGVLVTGVVTAYDPDAGQALVPTVTREPEHGTASVADDGTVEYEPDSGFAGTDTFAVTFCDNGDPVMCDDATVSVSVLPSVLADSATFTGTTPVTIAVLANDRAVSGQPVVVRTPQGGTVTVQLDGAIVYTARPGTATDTFTYAACVADEPLLCTEAVVTLTAADGPGLPPVIEDATATTQAGTPVTVPLVFMDPEGEVLRPEVATDPEHGTVVVEGTAALYTPVGSAFSGIDTATITVCDPDGCATATLTVVVLPVATADVVDTEVGQPAGVDVRANDLGRPRAPVLVAGPSHGDAEVDDDGLVLYTPGPAFSGRDVLTYRVCAVGHDDVCATATLTVWVRPVASALRIRTTAGTAAEVALQDGRMGAGTVPEIVVGPVHGTASVRQDGTLRYVPEEEFTGIETVTYRGCAPGLPEEEPLCASAVLLVEVAPDLHDDAASTMGTTPVVIRVAANDHGQADDAVVVGTPSGGRAAGADAPDVGGLTYRALTGFAGTDTFQYERCAVSAPGVCATAHVAVDVLAAETPEAPVTPDAPDAVVPPTVPGTSTAPDASGPLGTSDRSRLATSGPSPLPWLAAAALSILLGAAALLVGHRRGGSTV